jgi:DNA-binding PadR family transcriptional regulator
MYTALRMLEMAILGLLKEQELHGYELKKRLVDTLGFASGVSFGSLYPALARLETAGAVEAAVGSAPAGPATGSLSGELAAFRARKGSARGTRGKKVYRITPRGEALFEELLATENQSSDDQRLFNLRLAFARYLPPDARLGMLERRRAHLVERLIQLRTRVKAVRDAYARSLVEHDQEAAEHDLSWIERLIALERAAAANSSPTDGPSLSTLRPYQEESTT